MSLRTGLSASLDLVISTADTAAAMQTGSVPVLSTPRLIALCEEVSLRAVTEVLEEGDTTVGLNVRLDHLHPCGVGETVTADASLEKIDGRRLMFNVSVKDRRGLVAAGKITRVIVNQERFMERVK